MTMPPPLPPATVTPQKAPSFLAWWGILPLALMVGVESVYGGAPAGEHAMDPWFVVGYRVGGAVGGFAIAAVLGWIVFRIARRSQLAGTLTFTGALLLFCLGAVGQSQRRGASHPTDATFEGFSLTIPTGWVNGRPTKENNKALLAWMADGAAPEGVIAVDVGAPAPGLDALVIARSLAGADGKVSEDVTVDGETGMRAETTSTNLSRPKYAVVVMHKGQTYLIMGASTGGVNIGPAFDEVVGSWKWKGK